MHHEYSIQQRWRRYPLSQKPGRDYWNPRHKLCVYLVELITLAQPLINSYLHALRNILTPHHSYRHSTRLISSIGCLVLPTSHPLIYYFYCHPTIILFSTSTNCKSPTLFLLEAKIITHSHNNMYPALTALPQLYATTPNANTDIIQP